MGRWFGRRETSGITAASHSFETTEQFQEKLYEHLHAVLERRVVGEDASVAIRWHQPPFRGLLSFEFEHGPVFFGRARARNEVRELVAIQETRGRAFVLVLGASGSGKSSLVKAGILPDLMLPGMVGDVALCRYAIMRPSDNPSDVIAALAAAILSETALPELKTHLYDTERIAALLREAPGQCGVPFELGLTEAAKAAHLTEIAAARLVIVVDQLEEIFTIATLSDQERSSFVAALAALAGSGLVWVIATMRSDFFDRLESFPALAELAGGDSRYLLLPPTNAELAQIIREPAREAGLRFELDPSDGMALDEIIRAAARDRDALPLLSFVLDELWRRRNDHGVLTFEAYRSLGGLEGALARRAEAEFDALTEDVRAALPRVLRALVTLGQEGQVTSRPAALAMFNEGSPERKLIEAFAAPDSRLFVTAADDSGGEPKVRLAHEALLTHWKRASDYLEANRADLQLEARLLDAERRWTMGSERVKESLLLPSGLPLEEASDLLNRRSSELTPGLRDFVRRSLAAAEADRRLRRRITLAAVASLTLLSLASIGALFFGERSASAVLVAQSLFLARDAQRAVDDGNAVTGMLLALEALPRRLGSPNRPFVVEAESALERALANQRELKVLSGHLGRVGSAMFSPDGKRIVTASDDGTARIWDAHTGTTLLFLRGQDSEVHSAAFAPDGNRVLTATMNMVPRVWDARTGATLLKLNTHVQSAAFSADGSRIVTTTAGLGGFTTLVWNARTGKQLLELVDDKDLSAAISAVFSRDGTRIVTTYVRTARVRDAKTGASLLVLRGHEGWVRSAAFSADGKRIVTASDDRTARVWDAKTGQELITLLGHELPVVSAEFSADGARIVTASFDNTARVWNARTGEELLVLRGHEADVHSASFSPDGTRIVTASSDKTARVWDASSGVALVERGGGEGSGYLLNRPVSPDAFSPDGSRIVTAPPNQPALVWEARTGRALMTLRGRSDASAGDHGESNSANFSPDGRRIVTSRDLTALVWDAETGAELLLLRGHGGLVRSAAFSPDGTRIVTAATDATVRVWDAHRGITLLVLRDHASSATFSPDGTRIVTASTEEFHDSEGRRLVTPSKDRFPRVWDARSGTMLLTLNEPREGRVNTRGDDSGVAAFSPDGGRIITAAGGSTPHVWDARTGAKLLTLLGHESAVVSAVFSRDGTRIVTASADGTARVWDARTGAALVVMRPPQLCMSVRCRGEDRVAPSLAGATISGDGSRIVTATTDGTSQVWASSPPLHCEALINRALRALPRQLTRAERAREFLEKPSSSFFLAPLLVGGERCE
jgi:WD40 repeat protein